MVVSIMFGHLVKTNDLFSLQMLLNIMLCINRVKLQVDAKDVVEDEFL
jgi:hypothetical protein